MRTMRISKNIKRKNRVLSNLSHIELSGCLFLRKKKKDRKKRQLCSHVQ